jgi:hypothetical protein
MNLHEFLSSNKRNAWIEEPGLEIYVRRTIRFLGSRKVEILDIANVSAEKPGQGYFTEFLSHAEVITNSLGISIYIENIMDERFEHFFIKRGYKKVTKEYPPSYVLYL